MSSSSSSSVSSPLSRPITTNAAAGQQHRSDSAYTPSICSSITSSSGGAQQRGRHCRSGQDDCGENGLAATGQGGGGEDAGQERTMGLMSAILMIVGTLIGTGIFASPGPLFDSVHCTQTSFIIWAFAGIVCTIGAFAYTELGTMFPSSGGDFQYLRRAYGKKVAWVFGWSFITILNPIGTAGIAGVMGRYSVDLIAYSRTGNSIGASSVVRAVSPAGSAAGATSQAQDAIINTLGRMMWTSINGTASVWAAGAGAGPSGTGSGANMSPNPALNTGNAPYINVPHTTPALPPSQQQNTDAMPWLVRGFSIGAIVLMGLINIFFREGGKYASNMLAIFKIAGMCMLIVIGSMQAVKNHAQSEALQIPIEESSQNVLDYVSALCFAFFAYNGFNNINLGLGELRDPEKNLKRAVFIAMPFVTILFLLANFAFFSILSSYDLRHVHSLSLHAGHTVLGQPGGFLMAGTVVASALGSINANIWAGSRLLVIMAKDNTIIPFPVARVWNRTGTQAIAILILVGQASFHSLINLDFKTFSKIYSAVGWTWYGLSVAGLLYLRKKRPNYPRPVKVYWPLAAFFVVIAAVLVVGSLTLAFMSSAVQKPGSGGGGEEDDIATGGGADGGGAGEGKYVSIIMFGMVILFMMGVIPAFYLTKRYNQEHSSTLDNKTTTGNRSGATSTESDPEDDGALEEEEDNHHRNGRLGRGDVGGAGEMIQIQRPAPLHQTAITIDFGHTFIDIHNNNNQYLHPNNTDPTSLTVGGVGSMFGAFGPETLQDGRPARRHSAASSVTLVGEASKKRKNKQRRPKSKGGSKPTHHHGHHGHQHREHGRQGGEPSRSQSLDPIVPAHCSDDRKQGDNVVDEEEEEVARVQALRNSLSGVSGGAGDVTRYLSLDHVELGTRSPAGITSSSSPSRTISSNGSINTSDDSDSDIDFTSTPDSDDHDHEETYNGNTRPTIYTHNRPTHLFFPFDPSSSSSPSTSSFRPQICTSPTMLSPFGSRSQTAFNSPLIDSSSPTFATAGGPGPSGTYLTCGFNTRSGSHSSEMTLALDGDYHHEQEQEQGETSEVEDVKGKGVRTRQSSACERVDEVAEEEEIDGGSQAGRSNVNISNNNNSTTTTTTHYGSYLTDFHNNNSNNNNNNNSSSNGNRRGDDADEHARP
ncbi:b(0,+)-type amino acid transporter 1 [Linnemannia gamsii]|uniref:B(0,+)-type amino acid transporter 1 n=1 Tax=Linnemannia gamsii TaxID=64522 RepID=A0ABQ7K8R8_9FUNG|nr:b(0,+)-type amino acid transporter 1 [Linnemannia gamsii]